MSFWLQWFEVVNSTATGRLPQQLLLHSEKILNGFEAYSISDTGSALKMASWQE
jgi:hypothetical protein